MFKNFSENCAIYELMWKKYCAAEQEADENVAHVPCRGVSSLKFTLFPRGKLTTSHRRPIKIGLPNNFPNNHKKFLLEDTDRLNNGTAIITNLFLMSVSSKLKCYIQD
jgi:hypothetical protein